MVPKLVPNMPVSLTSLSEVVLWNLKNHVSKVSIASSTCPGFIYQWQKSIIIRTDARTHGNISLAAPANVRSASRNYIYWWGGEES